MKIVLPANNNNIEGHFGHAPEFAFFTVENNEIVREERVESPGHKPGFLPNFLADKGANVIIVGGMGKGAIDIFEKRDVQVVMGASGDLKENVEKFLKGELKSQGSVCNKHEHHHECSNH